MNELSDAHIGYPFLAIDNMDSMHFKSVSFSPRKCKVKQVLDKMKTNGLMPTRDAVFRKLNEPRPSGIPNAHGTPGTPIFASYQPAKCMII